MLFAMQQNEGPLSRLRRDHERLVLDLLRKQGPMTRGELGGLCGLSRTTLYDIISALVASGAVVTSVPQSAHRGRGRPVERLTLNPQAGQAIGIDFARRAVHVAVVNVAHEIVGTASETHGSEMSEDKRVDVAQRLVGRLTGGALRLGALGAIGVGVVGPVGRPGEEAGLGHNGDTLAALVRERFEVPVLVDNNTRLAALAESTWGAATGEQDVLYLRLSHGVGGGLVVGGALHRGAEGLSGEFGHITVDPEGAPCGCGGTGCLETVASVGAVLGAYRAQGGRADDVPALIEAIASGDARASSVVSEAGARVGSVLAAVCNAIGPAVIVVGGELAALGRALTEPVERALSANILPVSRWRMSLRPAELGEAGAALGGIALVLHESPLLTHYPAESKPEEKA
ncbi:ROK family transcriptional regulator [Phaeacidiphilus oryzae]|uniref:ROK family transcriptional regulator n=1 Tax=Phaeacidiphilus oryzae TaxID=348818 RepID=UPI00056002FC|nr:ROK family protein [Phaeacidiphilus oryzae]